MKIIGIISILVLRLGYLRARKTQTVAIDEVAFQKTSRLCKLLHRIH